MIRIPMRCSLEVILAAGSLTMALGSCPQPAAAQAPPKAGAKKPPVAEKPTVAAPRRAKNRCRGGRARTGDAGGSGKSLGPADDSAHGRGQGERPSYARLHHVRGERDPQGGV